MSGADLQWQEVDVPTGQLNEAVDPRIAEPGTLATAVNVTFESPDASVRKRPGTVIAAAAPSTGNGNKLVVHEQKDQLLVADLLGDADHIPALWLMPDAAADGNQTVPPKRVGGLSNWLVRRQQLMTDLTADIQMDVAYVDTETEFGYLVYGFIRGERASGTFVFDSKCGVKIVQVRKGALTREPENVVYESSDLVTGAFGYPTAVRVAPSNDTHVLVTFSCSGGQLLGVVVDCTPLTGPTVSAIAALGIAGTSDYDVCESRHVATDGFGNDIPSWIVASYSLVAGIPTLTVKRVTTGAPFAILWTVSTGYGGDPISTVAVVESGGKTWVNLHRAPVVPGANTGWWYYLIDTDLGVGLASVSWCTQATLTLDKVRAPGRRAAAAYVGSVDRVVLFHTQNATPEEYGSLVDPPTSPGGFFDCPITRWRSAHSDGTFDAIKQKRNAVLWSKPWPDSTADGWLCAWVGVPQIREIVDFSAGATAGYSMPAYDFTAALVRFNDGTATETTQVTQLLATALGRTLIEPFHDTAPAGYRNGGRPVTATQPASVTHQAYTVAEADQAQLLGRRTCLNARYVPIEDLSGPWDVAAYDAESDGFLDGYGRATSVLYGNSVYLAGGVLTTWDGDRVAENNFLGAPNIGAFFSPVGGGATVWPTVNGTAPQDGMFYVQAIYETVQGGNERVRSSTSAVLSFHLDNVVAPANDMNLWLEPAFITTRDESAESPKTLVTVYGSDEYNSTTLKRWFRFSSQYWADNVCTPNALDPLTFACDPSSATVRRPPFDWVDAADEVIYNDSGELDNDMPYGGCTALCVHKDRLWVAGGDEPDLIWYSKERADGRPAEFALGQQIRIPGKRVTGFASTGDALLVFCDKGAGGAGGTYAVYGDGPNATGDPASGNFQLVPVSTTIGCVNSASIAITPQGALFKAPFGMCRGQDRALAQDRRVETSALAYTIGSTCVVPRRNEVRLFAHAGPLSQVLVYNYSVDKWATWVYTTAATELGAPALVDGKVLGDNVYILLDSGAVLRESETIFSDYDDGADGGYVYRQILEFAWDNFQRPQGYKRVDHMQLLLSPDPWADYSATPSSFPFGLKAEVDFSYAGSGTTQTAYWASYRLGQQVPHDGISRARMHIGKSRPAFQVTLTEDEPARRLEASDLGASVVIAAPNNVLRLRVVAAGGWFSVTVPPDTYTKQELADELNALFEAAGDGSFVEAQVTGANALVLQIVGKDEFGRGANLQVDSVANGSTLNSVVGFAVGGVSGTVPVAKTAQSGFILYMRSFEVGQAPGFSRLPKTASR